LEALRCRPPGWIALTNFAERILGSGDGAFEADILSEGRTGDAESSP
jgi:hypothetical protein